MKMRESRQTNPFFPRRCGDASGDCKVCVGTGLFAQAAVPFVDAAVGAGCVAEDAISVVGEQHAAEIFALRPTAVIRLTEAVATSVGVFEPLILYLRERGSTQRALSMHVACASRCARLRPLPWRWSGSCHHHPLALHGPHQMGLTVALVVVGVIPSGGGGGPAR